MKDDRPTGINHGATIQVEKRNLFSVGIVAFKLPLSRNRVFMNKFMIERRRIRELRRKDWIDHQQRKELERGFIATSYSGEKFYKSSEWKALRYKILKIRGNSCEACGRAPKNGAIIQVDHVKPRFLFPELAFDPENLQVLCKDCNEGKGINDQTRWSSR